MIEAITLRELETLLIKTWQISGTRFISQNSSRTQNQVISSTLSSACFHTRFSKRNNSLRSASNLKSVSMIPSLIAYSPVLN